MGMLVEGEWKTDRLPRDCEARFVYSTTTFRDRLTAGGSSGLPAQAGRYHLYISWACPWAPSSPVSLRRLTALEGAVSLSRAEPFMSDDGWAFSNGSGGFPIHCMARGLREICNKAVY